MRAFFCWKMSFPKPPPVCTCPQWGPSVQHPLGWQSSQPPPLRPVTGIHRNTAHLIDAEGMVGYKVILSFSILDLSGLHMQPSRFTVALFLFLASATASTAQGKYDVFWGQYMASALIAETCKGVTTYSGHSAVSIGVARDGLREQRLLRILYYGNRENLRRLGHITLTMSGVSTDDPQKLCRYARKIARTDDGIGRFLRVN
ncbi:hypothetical protein PhaeoP70_02178 [Phaeobacter inhibens]|nr:hypothetical protein PhaeoP92_02179 [Phaeobacter inhibens]AUQ78862.1 hypothetical protein PhaeoP74_02180 [Phaeobacter inhibens]AUR16021.1 hypothetical protein PhaeoP70_02178 [Phaeobacter inhibens]